MKALYQQLWYGSATLTPLLLVAASKVLGNTLCPCITSSTQTLVPPWQRYPTSSLLTVSKPLGRSQDCSADMRPWDI